MAIRCVTFDLDDTLWDTGPVIVEAERRFYDWLERHCSPITARFDARSLVAHRQDFMAEFPHERHDLTGLRKRWLIHLFETHGVDPRRAEEAFRVFWEQRNAVTLFDGVEGILAGLKPRYSVGVITNGNACVHFIGIGHYFDFVVSSERAGRAKPAPEIFRLALADAGIDAHQVAHVGDDPTNDVSGAAAVGMRTVWYNPQRRPWPGGSVPDATISELSQLHEALADLERG